MDLWKSLCWVVLFPLCQIVLPRLYSKKKKKSTFIEAAWVLLLLLSVLLALWGLPLMVEVEGWSSSVIMLAQGLISISTAVLFPPSCICAHTTSTPLDMQQTGIPQLNQRDHMHLFVVASLRWCVFGLKHGDLHAPGTASCAVLHAFIGLERIGAISH